MYIYIYTYIYTYLHRTGPREAMINCMYLFRYAYVYTCVHVYEYACIYQF